MQETAKGFSWLEEALLDFWDTGPKCRTVHEGCNSHSECNPVLPCHVRWEEKSYYSDILDFLFLKNRIDRIESSKKPELKPSTSVVSETAACPLLLLLLILQLSISHLLSLLRSVTLLACSLTASSWMPVVVLYYCTSQGTIRLKMFSFFVFIYYWCESIINLLQYSTI